jgi:hypothetical protein
MKTSVTVFTAVTLFLELNNFATLFYDGMVEIAAAFGLAMTLNFWPRNDMRVIFRNGAALTFERILFRMYGL